MNENNIAELFNSIGAFVDLWVITFNNFLQRGFGRQEALEHTKSLFETILSANNINTDSANEEDIRND